jgi:hypothetical protein
VRQVFLGVNGLLQVDLVADDFADGLDLVVKPIVFTSGNVTIYSFYEGGILFFRLIENGLAVLDNVIAASFRYPVFGLELTILSLKTFPHLAGNISRK